MMIQEIGNNIIFPSGHIFHKSFVKTYKGMNVIQARRKLKIYYHKHMQDVILHYLKEKGLIHKM